MNVDTESCTRKEQKEVSFLNKHQTCQDVYDLPVQSRIEAAILGHTAPGTYFSLFESCFVMFFLVELSIIRGQHWVLRKLRPSKTKT